MNPSRIIEAWGFSDVKPRPDIHIPGSPERCLWRRVFEHHKQLYVLERLNPEEAKRSERLAQILHILKQSGLDKAVDYLPTQSGEFVPVIQDNAWRISRFSQGGPPPRPEYLHDASMGTSAASFLCTMAEAAKSVPDELRRKPFDLPEYVVYMYNMTMDRHPEIAGRLQVFRGDMEAFFEHWESLPTALQHGDFHPVNILWDEHRIEGVIDWEFLGVKTKLYDAANLLGCVGIEDPAMLHGGFAMAFLEGVLSQGLITVDELHDLHSLIPALRFGWLSEWLRKKDKEMVEIELDYLDLLHNEREDNLARWREALG
jgi:homoserine kinase type II